MITEKNTGMCARLHLVFKKVALILALPLLGSFMTVDRKDFLVDENNKPKEALVELLDLCNLRYEKSLESIVQVTQKSWYQPGKERWEFEERYSEKKEEALPLFQKLGCIDPVNAKENSYEYGILMGGLTSRMQGRINHLISEWKRGVRFKKLVILTGERRLIDEELPTSTIKTEVAMLLHLLENAHLPKELISLPCSLINSPMQGDKRPTTIDTVKAWLLEEPKPGTCLVFANQPFVCYFDAVLKSYLPASFQVETVGSVADLDLPLSVYLDNLARTLYQEQKRQ